MLLKPLSLSLDIELHDLFCLMARVEGQLDVEGNSPMEEESGRSTRLQNHHKLKVGQTKFHQLEQELFREITDLVQPSHPNPPQLQIQARIIKTMETIDTSSKQSTLKKTCTWRIICGCGHCNNTDKLDFNQG